MNVYADKAEAEKKAHKLKPVAALWNDIKVAVPEVPDQLLQLKQMRRIQYDRIGYGTTAFKAISVIVKNGVVVLVEVPTVPWIRSLRSLTRATPRA